MPSVGACCGCCPDCPSRPGGGGEALRGNWGWQQMRTGPVPAVGASTQQDGGAQEQAIFSNHQKLALVTVIGALPWSSAPAHLLHHPAETDVHHVSCCQCPPCSACTPWWSAHIIAIGFSVVLLFGIFAY